MPRRPTSSAREGDGDKRSGHKFAAVEAIGRALPDVEVTTAWGQPALKGVDALRDLVVGGHRFVNVQMRSKSNGGSRRGTARPSRDRR